MFRVVVCHTFLILYVRFLQNLNDFLFFFYFRFLWFPAKRWWWGNTVGAHPFLSLRSRHIGVWGIVLGVVFKLVIGLSRSEVRTVLKRTLYSTLNEGSGQYTIVLNSADVISRDFVRSDRQVSFVNFNGKRKKISNSVLTWGLEVCTHPMIV